MCPVCGRNVEIAGAGVQPLVSASEAARLCRRQHGTTHTGTVAGVAVPAATSTQVVENRDSEPAPRGAYVPISAFRRVRAAIRHPRRRREGPR